MTAEPKPNWLNYEDLADAIPGGVLAFDERGQAVYASSKAVVILGRQKGELEGLCIEEITASDWADACKKHLVSAKKGEQISFDFLVPHSPDERWARITLSPVGVAGESRRAIAVLTDIDKERTVAGRLREVENRMRDATANMPGVIYELHYHASSGIQLRYISDAALKYTGIDAWELMESKADIRPLLHPDDADRVIAHILRTTKSLAPTSLQFRIVGAAEVHHVITSASIAKDDDGGFVISGVAIDVGELETIESRRRASEAQLNAVFENFPFECWTLDLQGDFLLQNPSSQKRWGDLRGQPMSEADFPGGVHSECRLDVETAFAGGVARREIIVAEKGRQRYIERLVVPMYDGSELFGVLGVIVDKTDERMLEKQLAESKKLDAIGRLAGGVAHDFNNILTAIMSCVRLLERRLEGPPRRELQIIREGAQRAAQLTRQLLSFAKQERVDATRVSVDELLGKSDRLLRRLIGEDIELLTEQDANSAEVLVDPVRIEQAIINLVVNAKDAMSEGGTILVRSEMVELLSSRESVDGAIPPGEYARIGVRDTGVGMSEDTKARAFEPFFTTKHEQGGTGLGLSSVYGSVHQVGGFVTVESELGLGTCVEIYLPRASSLRRSIRDSESEVSGEEDADSVEVAASGGTILLVEDEPLVLSVACRSLRLSGYSVLQAGTKSEALEICKEYEGTIDLLLTDVVMPSGSGPSLSRQVRADRPGIAVLFMSGYGRDAVALGEGKADFLAKPFSPEELERKVRSAILGGRTEA